MAQHFAGTGLRQLANSAGWWHRLEARSTAIPKKSKRKHRAHPPAIARTTVGTAPPAHAAPRAPVEPPPAAAPPAWALWSGVAALLVVTTIALSPAFTAQLLSFDDHGYITRNRLLRSTGGLWGIWNPAATSLSQYYPLLFTSYWLEYQLWGANPAGYHAVNVLLHLANVALVFVVVRELCASAPVAFGTAAVFALHPTQVASVVWVAERKNTLSGLFYLLAFLLYLRHRRSERSALYAGSLAAFAAALLSKTQTLTLPASLLLAEWLLPKGRLRSAPSGAIAAKLAPMFALGLLAVLVTSFAESRSVGGAAFRLPDATQRFFIAANAPWFYAAKFLLPINLAPMYPRWEVSASHPIWWAGVLAWPLVAVLVARWRDGIGHLPLWGLGHLLVSLTPVLGVIPFGMQQHTFVADHYLYLAIIGAGLAVAARAERWLHAPSWNALRVAAGAAGVAVLAFYAAQSYREAWHWHDTPTFWRHVIERNPTAFAAYYSLGNYHVAHGQWAEAAPLYRQAFEIRPDSPGAFNGYTDALRRLDGEPAVIAACTTKIEQDAHFYAAYLQRARSYEQLGQHDRALNDYRQVLARAPKGSEAWRLAQRQHRRLEGGGGS